MGELIGGNPHIPGPGEVLSEFAQGLRNKVARGEMSALEGQAIYNRHSREIILTAILYPHIPFETGSTQIAKLIIKNSP